MINDIFDQVNFMELRLTPIHEVIDLLDAVKEALCDEDATIGDVFDVFNGCYKHLAFSRDGEGRVIIIKQLTLNELSSSLGHH